MIGHLLLLILEGWKLSSSSRCPSRRIFTERSSSSSHRWRRNRWIRSWIWIDRKPNLWRNSQRSGTMFTSPRCPLKRLWCLSDLMMVLFWQYHLGRGHIGITMKAFHFIAWSFNEQPSGNNNIISFVYCPNESLTCFSSLKFSSYVWWCINCSHYFVIPLWRGNGYMRIVSAQGLLIFFDLIVKLQTSDIIIGYWY